jgi:hypothetical protein
MRLLIAIVLIALPIEALAGSYKVTDAWPSGFDDRWVMMFPKYRPLCAKVAKALASTAQTGPLSCPSSFYHSSDLTRPTWSYMEKSRLLVLAKRLELLLDQPWQRRHWSETPEFSTGAEARIAAGTLTVALATVTLAGSDLSNSPHTPASNKTTILRYQRWGCSEFSGTTAPRIAYFVVHDSDLSDLSLLRGLGEPDDLFIAEGLAYFDGRSERDVDSHRKKLAHPQPELTVHEVMREDGFVQICRLLYWDSAARRSGKE